MHKTVLCAHLHANMSSHTLTILLFFKYNFDINVHYCIIVLYDNIEINVTITNTLCNTIITSEQTFQECINNGMDKPSLYKEKTVHDDNVGVQHPTSSPYTSLQPYSP